MLLSPITPPRRPKSLPPSPSSTNHTPSSTYLQLPFDPSHSTSSSTPQSTFITPSTTTPSPNREVKTAYVAERSSADLINVLDLVTPVKNKLSGIKGKTISPPLTPERSQFQYTSPKSPKNTTSINPQRISAEMPSPPRPPRPAVSPLDFDGNDDNIEEIIDQPHSLSAFNPSPRHHSPNTNTQRSPRQNTNAGLDESFWRWSQATSSVAQSEQNPNHRFHPPPASTYASSISQPPEMDKSFLRMTRTTIFSDFSAPSTVPDVPDPSTLPIPFRRPSASNGMTLLSAIPESAIMNNSQEIIQSPVDLKHQTADEDEDECSADEQDVPNVERRSSAGTFGYKNPRSSIIPSIRSNTFGNQDQSYLRDSRVNPFQPSSPPVASRVNQIRNHSTPRPLSMSSAAETTLTNSISAYSGKALDDTAIEARKALGVFTPPKGKIIHKHQESEAEIQDHLMRASERNERRIVPAEPNTPPKNTLAAPIDLNEDGGFDDGDRKMLTRNKSKIERMLGHDAENARVIMEMDRRALESVIETKITSQGLPPPPRNHKVSASMPTSPLSPQHQSRPSHALATHNRSHTVAHTDLLTSPSHASHAHSHLRSASIDSLPSLHPSLSESINTLSGLIPPSPTKPSYNERIPPASSSKVNIGRFTDIRARNDLTPEQRAILLRRTRKLEQMLGEALPENQVEKLVIDPTNTSSTYMTKNSEDVWPKTPPSSTSTSKGGDRKTPEWEREDCIPHRIKPSSTSPEQTLPISLNRSKSSLADKAKAALGLGTTAGFDKDRLNGKQQDEGKDELKVYVSRSLQESLTVSRGNSFNDDRAQKSVNRSSPSPPVNGKSQASSPTTPATATTMNSSNWPSDEKDDEEILRKNRRQQLAKLHRLLGAPIPPELLNPQNPTSPSFQSTFNTLYSQPFGSSSNRSPSPSQQSYISFEDTPTPSKWSSRLKVPLNSTSFRKKGSSSSPQQVADDRSFIDLRESGSKGSMSREEKSLARKRAAKLEQMLGDKPPPEYLHHSSSSSPLPSPLPKINPQQRSRAPTPPSQGISSSAAVNANRGSSYDAYVASLEGLLYLVENDQSRLGEMMDSLSITSPPTSPTRSSRVEGKDPHKHSLSIDSSRVQTPPSPLLDSPQSPKSYEYDFLNLEEDNDPQSHKARRRRTGKLSQFFGESIDISIPPEELPPPRDRRNTSTAHSNVAVGGLQGRWNKRKETLDGMLSEICKDVQSEIGRGEIKNDQGKKLEELLSLVKSREGHLGYTSAYEAGPAHGHGPSRDGGGVRERGGRGRWEMI